MTTTWTPEVKSGDEAYLLWEAGGLLLMPEGGNIVIQRDDPTWTPVSKSAAPTWSPASKSSAPTYTPENKS